MQRRNVALQGLIFGGLMAALVVVFGLIGVLAFLMPIPLVLTYLRYGGRATLLSAITAVLLTMAFQGVVQGLLIIPGGILPGVIFGLGLRRGWRPLAIGLTAVAVFFVGFAMSYVITRVGMFDGRDPFEAMFETETVRTQVMAQVDQLEAIFNPPVANPTPQQQAASDFYSQYFGQIRQDPVGFTWLFLPTSVFLLGAASTWLNWLMCRLILPRFGHPVPQPTSFAHFTLPTWVIWSYGLLLIASGYVLSPDVMGSAWWVKLLINIMAPLGMIVAMAGFAVGYGYLLEKWKLSKGMAAFIVVLIFMVLGRSAMQIFVFIVMWDAIFDFRGLGHGIWRRPAADT